jgi:hypothetical protein
MTQSSQTDPLGKAKTQYLRAKLKPFLEVNPEASFKAAEDEYIVADPWGVEGIEIPLDEENLELFNTLNSVRLPPRFTAI